MPQINVGGRAVVLIAVAHYDTGVASGSARFAGGGLESQAENIGLSQVKNAAGAVDSVVNSGSAHREAADGDVEIVQRGQIERGLAGDGAAAADPDLEVGVGVDEAQGRISAGNRHELLLCRAARVKRADRKGVRKIERPAAGDGGVVVGSTKVGIGKRSDGKTGVNDVVEVLRQEGDGTATGSRERRNALCRRVVEDHIVLNSWSARQLPIETVGPVGVQIGNVAARPKDRGPNPNWPGSERQQDRRAVRALADTRNVSRGGGRQGTHLKIEDAAQ